MALHTARILSWFRNALWYSADKPRRFTLRHFVSSQAGGALCSFTIPAEFPDCEESNKFLDAQIGEIERYVEEDSSAIGGVQTYALFAYAGDKEQSIARHVFRVVTETSGTEDSLSSEGPTTAGLTSQLMRHTEILTKTIALTAGQTIASQARMIEGQNEHIEKLHAQRIADLGAIEDMLSLKHERDLASSKLAAEESRANKLYEKTLLLAPVVINKLLGTGTGANADSKTQLSSGVLSESFIDSLKVEQLEAISKVLTPEQFLVVIELVNNHHNAKSVKPGTLTNGAIE